MTDSDENKKAEEEAVKGFEENKTPLDASAAEDSCAQSETPKIKKPQAEINKIYLQLGLRPPTQF